MDTLSPDERLREIRELLVAERKVTVAYVSRRFQVSEVTARHDLDVLADGVAEGRRIFANTIKYVLMGTSSNFGNISTSFFAGITIVSSGPITPPVRIKRPTHRPVREA